MVMGAPPSSGRSLRGGSFRCLNLGPTERRASGSPRRRSSGGGCACGRRGWAWRFPALLPRARVRRPSSSHRSPSALTTNPSECLFSVTLGAQLLAAPPSSWHLRDRPRKVVGHRTLYRTRAARVGKASAGAAKATSATAARRRSAASTLPEAERPGAITGLTRNHGAGLLLALASADPAAFCRLPIGDPVVRPSHRPSAS